MADQWVRIAYYFPITWAEYKNMSMIERFAIRMAIDTYFEEMKENSQIPQNKNDLDF